MSEPVLRAEGVTKEYRMGPQVIRALEEVTFSVPVGTLAVVVGPSGSGKTTLLNVLGALDRPTPGDVYLNGVALSSLPEGELTRVRREKVGFVFQLFELIPNLSALENVALPMEFRGIRRPQREARARELLEAVGMPHRATHRPGRLSGGEQQRVAIARALASDPSVILADEPTGNLDSGTGKEIVELLGALAHNRRKTVVVVTHDERIAELADVRMELVDGRLEPPRPVSVPSA